MRSNEWDEFKDSLYTYIYISICSKLFVLLNDHDHHHRSRQGIFCRIIDANFQKFSTRYSLPLLLDEEETPVYIEISCHVCVQGKRFLSQLWNIHWPSFSILPYICWVVDTRYISFKNLYMISFIWSSILFRSGEYFNVIMILFCPRKRSSDHSTCRYFRVLN